MASELHSEVVELEIQLAMRDCSMKKQAEQLKAAIDSFVTTDPKTLVGYAPWFIAKLYVLQKSLDASCIAIFALQDKLQVAQDFLYEMTINEKLLCSPSLCKLVFDIERDTTLGGDTTPNLHTGDHIAGGDCSLAELCRKKHAEVFLIQQKLNDRGKQIKDLNVEKAKLSQKIEAHVMTLKSMEQENKKLRGEVQHIQKSDDRTGSWRHKFQVLKANCHSLTLLAKQEFDNYELAKHDIIQRDRHIMELEEKIVGLEVELKGVSHYSEVLDKYEKVKHDILQKDKSILELEHKIVRLQDELNDARCVAEANDNYEQAKHDIKQRDRCILKLEKKIARLKVELEHNGSSTEAIENYEHDIRQRERRILELEQEIARLEVELKEVSDLSEDRRLTMGKYLEIMRCLEKKNKSIIEYNEVLHNHIVMERASIIQLKEQYSVQFSHTLYTTTHEHKGFESALEKTLDISGHLEEQVQLLPEGKLMDDVLKQMQDGLIEGFHAKIEASARRYCPIHDAPSFANNALKKI